MSSQEKDARLEAEPGRTAPTTEASSDISDGTSTNEKPTPHNPHDDPDRDEVEWMDRGHEVDLESQKSHVCFLSTTSLNTHH